MEDRFDKSPGKSSAQKAPEKKAAARRLGVRHDALLPVSIVGGLVGMLVGTLPATICAAIFGRAFSPLYAFLPLFIYLGIKLFKGYDGKRGIITVAVFSAIGFYLTLLSCQAVAYLILYKMLFLNLPLVTISLIGQSNVLRGPAISSAYVFPFVFTLFGVFLSEELMRQKKAPATVPEPAESSEAEHE
ncbi:hypothetical protein SAMN02745823_00621 [Sporobacter termitidis DSM 10068]|uniref:Uncharacterized protein n=1 Tax=Sporobacter termitidis DSM 10068 TaxID=1123282 RepID=A0A1M5UPS3_9FIRM|nr:hypothetical protein [Sporobacter termitidis]SHH64997.1 hypothetical protein SAMN02745823_00621 [Sporobacter termitidis DSM 10068]